MSDMCKSTNGYSRGLSGHGISVQSLEMVGNFFCFGYPIEARGGVFDSVISRIRRRRSNSEI